MFLHANEMLAHARPHRHCPALIHQPPAATTIKLSKKPSFTYGVVQPHRTSNTTDRCTRYNADLLNNKKQKTYLILFGQLLPKTGSFYGTARDRKCIPAAYLISNNFIFQKNK